MLKTVGCNASVIFNLLSTCVCQINPMFKQTLRRIESSMGVCELELLVVVIVARSLEGRFRSKAVRSEYDRASI
jgi:hypothetical protein